MKDLKKNGLVRVSTDFPSTFLVEEDILGSYHVEYYYKWLFPMEQLGVQTRGDENINIRIFRTPFYFGVFIV